MSNIVPFLRNSAFGPEEIRAMSLALDEVCTSLAVPGDDNEVKRAIAERIIALAERGDCNAAQLRDRVIYESKVRVT